MNGETPGGGMSRRTFLGATAVATALTLPASAARFAGNSLRARGPLVDVNVNLFRWPTRRLPCDETTALVARLRRYGVTQAWAGSFEGLLQKDLGGVNRRLASECRERGRGVLLPFGSINPKLPDWEEELRRCVEVYRMPGIRLNPDYHGYKLDDPDFVRLLRRASESRILVQLAMTMEDERTVHPRLRLDAIDLAALTEPVAQTPGLRLVLLNSLRTWRAEPLRRLLSAGDVYVEIAMLEGVGGVGRLLGEVPMERVLFASYAPFYYFESAWLKLQESPLDEQQLGGIREKNARRLLAETAWPQSRGA